MNESEMPSTETTNADNTRTVSVRAEIWHALLEIAGRQIDPETEEVCSVHRQVVDPYGVYPDLPNERDCIGRCYFAPGSWKLGVDQIWRSALGNSRGCSGCGHAIAIYLPSSTTKCLSKEIAVLPW